MKTVMLRTLMLALGAVLLVGAWQLAGADAGLELTRRLASSVLLVAGLGTLSAVLCLRLRSEDRIVRLEADLCREQNARSQADQALAEADLLLARLTVRQPEHLSKEASPPEAQVNAQLVHIQAELAQLQQYAPLDAACAGRLERARNRLEQVARLVRNAVRATEVG